METLMNDIPKILVIQTAFPGDAILTLPFIQELKKSVPESLIDVLCTPITAEIFGASPYVNSVLELDKRGRHKSFFSLNRFVKELKKNNYTKVYSPHRSLRSALITLQIGARETYGFNSSSLEFAYRNCINYNYSAHEVQRNLSLISEKYNNSNWKILPEVIIPDQVQKKVSDFLTANDLKKNFIVIAPGSVWQTKRYPVEYYKEIIRHLLTEKFKIVIIGGSDDKFLSRQLTEISENNIFDLCGEFSFIENIALLKSAVLLICNDSAPTHLGMCANIPVLTIYCSTVPEFGFYPYNDKSRYISYNDLQCKPCGIHGYPECPLSTFECAKKLTPPEAIKNIEEMISYND
jgi:heptosyltransferase II